MIIAKNLNVCDRMEGYSTPSCFITLKDHKDGFKNNPKCRLINPAKTDRGRVSKTMIENIIKVVKQKTGLNLWRNTTDVKSWFSNIPEKSKAKFIQFDIVEFYPSITPALLDRAINYASTLVDISDQDKLIINHAKKSLLFDKGTCWTKKTNQNFDVTMGSFDGAETCELVGLYILSKITNIIPNPSVGLYRDDGLAAIDHANGPKLDRIRKKMIKCFKEEGLKITIDINMKIADHLDITLNLTDGSYKPFRKPNDKPLYIHKFSNHPPNIIKNLPDMINKRLNNISSSKEVFDEAKPVYEEALQKSGHDTKLVYNANMPKNSTKLRQRKRKITW